MKKVKFRRFYFGDKVTVKGFGHHLVLKAYRNGNEIRHDLLSKNGHTYSTPNTGQLTAGWK